MNLKFALVVALAAAPCLALAQAKDSAKAGGR